MLKKLALGAAGIAMAVATVPMFAAFEAHVINVTARIENALSINTEPIRFGTVFPQEQLDRKVTINLSRSFLAEKNADDVRYIIRQKPKCGITSNDGQLLDEDSTTSGEPRLDAADVPFIDCGPVPRNLVTGEIWGPLPLLCPYLSKHPIRSEGDPSSNDGSLDAFHQIGQFQGRQWFWNDVDGYMAKSDNDTSDMWNLDLKVPCFKGHCAQDWDAYVQGINPNATSTDYIQDPANQHKVFGCDIWFEVTGVSRFPLTETQCTDDIDNDNDGLIDEDDPDCPQLNGTPS